MKALLLLPIRFGRPVFFGKAWRTEQSRYGVKSERDEQFNRVIKVRRSFKHEKESEIVRVESRIRIKENG